MENEDEERASEAVFIAGNLREIRLIEEILEAEGIEYTVRPEAFHRNSLMSSGPFEGLLFEVLPGQASYCRKLLIAKGLQHGVVSAEPDHG